MTSVLTLYTSAAMKMMRINVLIIVYLLAWITFPSNSHATFIPSKASLTKYNFKTNLVMVASTGRSGSTMLTEHLKHYVPPYNVLKTHLLPPDRNFKGKIIFIFSNPDQAAESALYMTLHKKNFGKRHFTFVETADRLWLKKIGGPYKQTEQDNLLSYDALGTYQHLKIWLYTQTKPTDPKHAQILAVKYENLWDDNTIQAIRNFLHLPNFQLPPKLPRGHKTNLYSHEKSFRKIYNLGTVDNPRYAAYEDAKILWEQAPPFQYLRISSRK